MRGPVTSFPTPRQCSANVMTIIVRESNNARSAIVRPQVQIHAVLNEFYPGKSLTQSQSFGSSQWVFLRNNSWPNELTTLQLIIEDLYSHHTTVLIFTSFHL